MNNKIELITDAIEACDLQSNCVSCSQCYKGFEGDKSLIPCNYIRELYGESIWDYKKGRKELN